MKLVYISDLHLRPTAPINRKDDYVETQFSKLDFLIDKTNEVDGVLVIGGDVFDRACNHPSWFVNRVIVAFSRANRGCSVIPGNHDLIGHSMETLASNTLYTLSLAQNVYVPSEVECDGYKATAVTLVPFGCQVPAPVKERKYNIVVMHEPVFENSVPFYMKDGVTVAELEAKYPGYDLYLVGDIHIPCQKSKTLVSGSMMRMTSVQKEQKPRFYIIDTETLDVETVFFPIEDDVWKLELEVETSSEFKEELKDLAQALADSSDGIDYPTAVKSIVKPELWDTFDRLINEYKSKKEK